MNDVPGLNPPVGPMPDEGKIFKTSGLQNKSIKRDAIQKAGNEKRIVKKTDKILMENPLLEANAIPAGMLTR
jgi:hypothetical protein